MTAKALVVFSGGQDSTTCLALAHATFGASNVACITFDYGQRHRAEIEAAVNICKLLGIEQHEIIKLGNDVLSSTSPLTDPGAELETYIDHASMEKTIGTRVEKTFVPMRNALFLTIAANRAVCLGATVIYTGVCQADNANYPDCRAAFITAQGLAINEALGTLGTRQQIGINTPLIFMSKKESIHMLQGLGYVNPAPKAPGDCPQSFSYFSTLCYSHTAYDGLYPPTGKDHASVLRAHGFEQAGVPDPLVLRAYRDGSLEDLPSTSNYNDARTDNLVSLGVDIDQCSFVLKWGH